jgi:putative Mn2+ efflux pump MntP
MTGFLTLGALGLSLSVDAFAAAIGKGATAGRPKFSQALKTGAVFGSAEAISPAIGWLIGKALSGWIMAVSDWVAFALLVAVGGHMLWEAWRGSHDETPEDAEAAEAARQKAGGIRLMLTAVATSIDAMAVGVSLAVLNIGIVSACIVIGLVTTVIATTGVMIGRHAGEKLGPLAEVLGGIALIGIGAMILVQHYWMG